MPKPTFFNLPEDKRARIIELAVDEFAERPYGEASLSRIVARAGIAKGSMYQYFEDKLDLYRWLLVEVVGSRKRAYVTAAARGVDDLFARLEGMAVASLQFAVDEPRLCRMAASIALPSGDPGLRAMYAEFQAMAVRLHADMIQTAQLQGQVRKDIDPTLAAVLVAAALNHGLMQGLLSRLGIDETTFYTHPELTRRIAPEELRRLVADVVVFLRAGLGAARAEPERSA